MLRRRENFVITLEQACDIIKKMFPKHDIKGITNIDDGWIFGASYGDDEYPLTYVSKETGKTEPFDPLKNYDKIENAFNIEIPEKYR